ncbi:MAG: NAD(+) synthase [Nanoarchaeota archaeon]|nr:NAD(+) synthase [Nanoarchaeota archaeon]
MKATYSSLVRGIKGYFTASKKKNAIIGLSGGIDSALSLKLVTDALGPKNITALMMPERGLTKKRNVDDTVSLCKHLNVKYHLIPINPFLTPYKKLPWRQSPSAVMNTKARVRMAILYNKANSKDALVIGTTNKSELLLGYFTKHGDGACDIEVIARLYKTQVYELARFLKLPQTFIDKTPTAELARDQSDEAELGMTYEEIDRQLKKGRLKRKIKESEHKRKPAKII